MSDEMRQRLCEATRHSLAAIDAGLSKGDLDSIKVELHSMRGGFAMAGDTEASGACARAERIVAEDGIEALKAAWPVFDMQIERALARLSESGSCGSPEPD